MDATQMRPFLFEGEITVRVIEREGAPWFVAADVCRALGIQQAARAVKSLDSDEKGVSSIHTLGGDQEVHVVSESGLFTLILRSRQATTPGTIQHRFRKWVTAEVLPALRRTGTYTMPESAQQPPQPEVMIDRPWRERPAEERRVELSTIASIRTNGNHALAWWYLSEVAKVANFPRHLLSPWQQALNFPPTGGNQLMVIMGGGNSAG